MSGTGDASLLELFREDVRTNVQVLNDGLVALEQAPSNIEQIEPLMRAAHSIKGAARVMGIDSAVKLAHAAEDCLVAAQDGRITLCGDDIDMLFSTADLLAGIAESAGPHLPQWLAESGGEIDAVAARLSERSQGARTPVPTDGGAEPATPSPATERPVPTLNAAIALAATRSFEASPLIDLFRDETRTNVETLRAGLASAIHESPGPDALESLMRAAHSIKGAARVVNVDIAVEMAGMVEEVFVRVQQGQLALVEDSLEPLLLATDILDNIADVVGPEFAEWATSNADRLNRFAAGISAIQSPPDAAATESSKPSADGTIPSARRDSKFVGSTDGQPASTPPPARSAAQPTGEKAAASAESTEQVVRVTAQSLTRLMGLAGESLVEARWLQPFSKSLLELKRQQALVTDSLEELKQELSPEESEDRRATLLADADHRLLECRRLLARQIAEFENRARNADDLNNRLYHEVIASRMRPFRDGVQGFPRMVRDVAKQLGKKVSFKVRGEATEVDRDILEKLDAPLGHILRNALDHGLETPAEREAAGKPKTCAVEIEARHNAGMLVITVTDDGRGIDLQRIRQKVIDRRLADERIAKELSDPELLEFLFLPAFSTVDGVTDVSGRGVGLDVVHGMVHAVGGSIRIRTEPGLGTTFQLELPITLSVIRAVLVKIAGEPYAFPHNRIDRLVRISKNDLNSLESHQHFDVDGRNVGVVLAWQVLETEAPSSASDSLFIILFSNHSDQYGLVVDEFCGERDLVVRPLDPRLGKVPNINAAAILDDGSPVLVVDLDDLRRSIEKMLHAGSLGRAGDRSEREGGQPAKRVLVVDDSITVREVQRQLLANQGYEVATAVDGMEGWGTLTREDFDLVITDIDMPRLNGIDLVRMIKKDPRLRTTPVVIVSYKDREEDRLKGLEAGADYYLTKSSFHDETLLGAVKDLIGDAH